MITEVHVLDSFGQEVKVNTAIVNSSGKEKVILLSASYLNEPDCEVPVEHLDMEEIVEEVLSVRKSTNKHITGKKFFYEMNRLSAFPLL